MPPRSCVHCLRPHAIADLQVSGQSPIYHVLLSHLIVHIYIASHPLTHSIVIFIQINILLLHYINAPDSIDYNKFGLSIYITYIYYI